MTRTRIKVCGLTRVVDVEAAVDAGVDAIGLVFYPPSPRHVTTGQAAELARHIPPFVSTVGLFVNASRDDVRRILDAVPLSTLQFHGDEPPEACTGHGLPWIKATRVRPETDLLEFARLYAEASGILLDADSALYGGSGHTFDWSLVPLGLGRRLILSGGLTPANVEEAVRCVRPWAVDVSSGVEALQDGKAIKGVKDAARMAAFISGVRNAD